MLTKKDMAEIIINSPAWDGTRSVKELCKEPKDILRDIYDMLDEAEAEYYENL